MKRYLRKLICVLAVLTLMLTTASAVFASSVTYENQAEKFVFAPGSEYSLTDLFTNYKGVMPGDKLTQKVTVRNDASEKVDVEIFMRALGATDLKNPEDGIKDVSQAASQDFLEEMTLTVVQDGNSELFNAPADQTAQLTDWVSLGKFKSGEEVDLVVELTVPIEMNNDYAAKIGALDWQFKVNEYEIVEPTEPTEPSEEPIKETKTGDDMNLILPIALMGAAALALIIVLATRRRKQEQ